MSKKLQKITKNDKKDNEKKFKKMTNDKKI